MTAIVGGLRVSRSGSTSGNNSGADAIAYASVRGRGERITIPPAGCRDTSVDPPPPPPTILLFSSCCCVMSYYRSLLLRSRSSSSRRRAPRRATAVERRAALPRGRRSFALCSG